MNQNVESCIGKAIVEPGQPVQVNLPSDKQTKGIGKLNGWWERLFKIAQLSVPIILGMSIWTHTKLWDYNDRLTVIEQWKDQGGRFTQEDWLTHQQWIVANIEYLQKEIDSKPPPEMLKRLDSMERSIVGLGDKIDRHLELHSR